MNRINSFFRDTATKKEPDVTVAVIPEARADAKLRRWKPTTLQRPFLLAVICITLGLLALVQALVIKDERNDGLLFAPRISELGAFDTFLHQYLPTTVAVLYSFVWSWIDLDVRRVEPYRQLSKPGGASGENSLLLHYTYDFLGFVPITSFKRKHWHVFASSCALILVAWGVTPLQGAIFATGIVTKSSSEPMQLSSHHLSVADQTLEVTANYTYSASNIVWLNERLPAFMTREAAFSAFKLGSSDPQQNDETWTARTTSFSVDLNCESAVLNRTGVSDTLDSSHGCQVPLAFGPDGTDIVGDPDQQYEIKEFSAFFAGNQNHDGLADYYLSPYCPKNVTDVFMVTFARNRQSPTDPPRPATKLFCQTSYFQQAATATVRRIDGNILNATDHGPKAPLPPGLFNTSLHEWQMNSATQQNKLRGSIPSTEWPAQDAQLAQLPLTMPPSYVKSSKVIGLALGAYDRPLEDYLDASVLTALFERYHRLMFARAMADVLSVDFEGAQMIEGTRYYQTEAVRVVPGFAYAVEGLLGLIAVICVGLTFMTWDNRLKLQRDPNSVAALMSLVSGEDTLLKQFLPHDRSSLKMLERDVRHRFYALESPSDAEVSSYKLIAASEDCAESESCDTIAEDPKALYPGELSRKAGACLGLALASILAATACLYQTSRSNGLSLPSQNRFVRQMLENYVPTIIATLIEPVWVLLNRYICTLQPFDALRSGRAYMQRSISLNYSSLPPQFVAFKAIVARHFILTAVCIMAILAKVLAIAFSGMFNEDTAAISRPTFVANKYEPRFRTDLEDLTKFGPNAFYTAMANFTSATPMPAWTDDDAFYLPLSMPAGLNSSDYFEIETSTFELEMNCLSPSTANGYSWNFTLPSPAESNKTSITAQIPMDSGSLSCSTGPLSFGTAKEQMSCSKEQMALEVIMPMIAEDDATPEEHDECQKHVLGIWARRAAEVLCTGDSFRVTPADATAMICKPDLVRHLANVTVTGDEIVSKVRSSQNDSAANPKMALPHLSDSEELVKVAAHSFSHTNLTHFDTLYYYGGLWHNDDYPSNWMSYVMKNMEPSSKVLESSKPPPDFDTTVALFSKAYRKVFAIWLNLIHEQLLEPANSDSASVVGAIVRAETRIVVSKSMVILAAIILSLYLLVAFAVYVKQPAKFLPRMPTTIASDIALFAASKAVGEMGYATAQDYHARPGDSRLRFGYGPFVGTDGKAHVGIERSPFVNTV